MERDGQAWICVKQYADPRTVELNPVWELSHGPATVEVVIPDDDFSRFLEGRDRQVVTLEKTDLSRRPGALDRLKKGHVDAGLRLALNL